MMKMNFDIRNIFQQFVNYSYNNYRIGDGKIYDKVGKRDKDQYCLNQYLKTEDYLKVKFAAFAESILINDNTGFTIHSEFHLYESYPSARADLSIYRVNRDKLQLRKKDILDSLIAVIEIKYENYSDPYYSWNMGSITKDMIKLSSLENKVEKYLLIYDEAVKITNGKAKEILKASNEYGLEILSNNPWFSA